MSGSFGPRALWRDFDGWHAFLRQDKRTLVSLCKRKRLSLALGGRVRRPPIELRCVDCDREEAELTKRPEREISPDWKESPDGW